MHAPTHIPMMVDFTDFHKLFSGEFLRLVQAIRANICARLRTFLPAYALTAKGRQLDFKHGKHGVYCEMRA
jgi:hypothetical protein